MDYQLGWSKNHPGHVVYLLDLSGSMENNGKIDRLITAVHDVVIDLIQDSSPSGIIEDNMTLTIIGYNSVVKTLVDNCTLSQLFNKMVNNGNKLLDKNAGAKPQWQTFTAAGLREVAKEIRAWMDKQQKANKAQPAPLVVHVTDGYPYEGEGKDESSFVNALQAAEELKGIRTDDGNVRLFNIHIEPGMPTYTFPVSRPSGTNSQEKVMKFLFDSASVVDEGTKRNADLFLDPGMVKAGSRFMVSNVSGKGLLSKLIQFGSTPPSKKPNPYQESPMP